MARQPRVPGAEQPQEGAADHLGVPEQLMPEAPAAEPGVLRAADVDPSKLRRAVLTADGWVCPVDAPNPKVKE
jgi:hypothetical protein